MKTTVQERVLTEDRTTGKLYLGHYVGSLKNRVDMQYKYDTFILLADVQALTTHFEKPQKIGVHLRQIALDYLSAGSSPTKRLSLSSRSFQKSLSSLCFILCL